MSPAGMHFFLHVCLVNPPAFTKAWPVVGLDGEQRAFDEILGQVAAGKCGMRVVRDSLMAPTAGDSHGLKKSKVQARINFMGELDNLCRTTSGKIGKDALKDLTAEGQNVIYQLRHLADDVDVSLSPALKATLGRIESKYCNAGAEAPAPETPQEPRKSTKRKCADDGCTPSPLATYKRGSADERLVLVRQYSENSACFTITYTKDTTQDKLEAVSTAGGSSCTAAVPTVHVFQKGARVWYIDRNTGDKQPATVEKILHEALDDQGRPTYRVEIEKKTSGHNLTPMVASAGAGAGAGAGE